ncbi:AGE family epimerase/isomerase [Limobrevibacterium gyesilva]|uniref:AGE family epimerase/isomerase n=1 Tax=Limobrevibacterium gyesilva TaxID=2991712 RepID=A0AA42CFW7_9PROT|nr:AGE family epimerase/isomerase [Limobrevibacterium gyesilva]MCW3475366.1 AGE family epimerase/isomerase [Limobrevibacterium gyesilva]
MRTATLTDSPTGWLIEQAWPLWLQHGVDWAAGAFHESLDPATLTCPAPFRRLRVAARQTYVFAQAARAGVPRAEAALRLGMHFLRTHARQEDGGYAWRFGLDNAPIDQTRDLYDHAFVLLAFAEAAAVLPGAGLDGDAAALSAYIDRHFPHQAGGFRESLPDRAPRRQNPHMHLLEALLAAHETFGGCRYLDRAEALVALLLDRLLQPAEGALPEFFDPSLRPLRDAQGRFVVEPGHHFEWVWLLDRHLHLSRAAGREPPAAPIEAAMRRLMQHAEAHGIDAASGLVLASVHSDGTLCDPAIRLWPQTERLKAAAARPDLARIGAARCLELLGLHFAGAPPGLWQEWLRPGGTVDRSPAPASSLYHLTCALTAVAGR